MYVYVLHACKKCILSFYVHYSLPIQSRSHSHFMLCEFLVAPAVAVLFHMSTSHTVARECVCVCTNAIMCVCAYKYVAAPYMYLDVVHFNIYSRDYRIRKDQQKQKTKNNKKNKQPNELHSTTNEKERREAKKNNKNPEENHYTCGYHEQK